MPLYGPLAARGRLGAAEARYQIGVTDIREQIELAKASRRAARKQERGGLFGGLGGLGLLALITIASGGTMTPLAMAGAAGGGAYVGRRGARTPMPTGMFRQEQRRQMGEELRGRELAGALQTAGTAYGLGTLLGPEGIKSFMDLLKTGGLQQRWTPQAGTF